MPVEKNKKQDNECDQVITLPQLTDICWFTALLMSVFFSQYSRSMLLNKIDKDKDKNKVNTGMTNELKTVLWDIMQKHHKSVYEMKDSAYKYFKVITPEFILKRLYEYNSKEFVFNPDERSGYYNYTYLPKLLRFMGAKDLLLLDLDKWKPILTHSVVDKGLKIATIKKDEYRLEVDTDNVDTDLLDEYDYVIIYVTDMPKGNHIYARNFKIAETFEHRNKTYLLDSMLLTNFNSGVCNKGHDVCGITCQGDRYVYNGWVRSTIDPSIPHDVHGLQALPCELMKYDWSQDIGDFCINPSACSLDILTTSSAAKHRIFKSRICFNFHKGNRVYIYVNKDRAARSQTPKNPMKKITSSGTKECPPGTILNEKTKRCNKIKPPKECPPGTILNEKTRRCNKIKENKHELGFSPRVKNLKASMQKKRMEMRQATQNDKLFFFSKSKDAAPGKGANEVVEKPDLYDELNKMKDWRKVLSNFHEAPFVYDGYTWNTIEHVFQAKKIELVDPEKAQWFTVESGHEIGRGDGGIARKHRKLVVLEKTDLATWAKMRNDIMFEAAVEKYKQHPEALGVLKATHHAQLWHVVMRSKPERFEHLEKVRDLL